MDGGNTYVKELGAEDDDALHGIVRLANAL